LVAYRIAVIGAGLAGLSCATALQQAGLEVSVFEKSRGPAGRMATRRRDDWQCDHGAQYFTARHPDFRDEVARWRRAGVAAPWAPRLQALEGATIREPDPRVERFVGIPRMTSPARLLAETLAVTPDTTIQRMQREADGWQLSSAERGGMDDRFDAVLLAVPSPQAEPLLRQPAPELAALAGSAVMRGCWAMMLRLAEPAGLPFDAAFVNHGPLSWVARNNSKPGRSAQETWLLHAGAQWSEAHLEQDADSVAAAMLEAFVELGGPAPQAWTAHRWRYATPDPALGIGCAWDAGIGVGLCGDWLSGGRVEGAWLSGRELAQRVLSSPRPQ
jgi:predicted NAD/FAD-dependent oxidoreductase